MCSAGAETSAAAEPDPSMSLRQTNLEILRFLIVGSLTVGIDYVFYRLGLSLGIPVSLAKALGFIAGTIFAYVANRRWTFRSDAHLARSISFFFLIYLTTLIVNLIVNRGALAMLSGRDPEVATVTAFLAATLTSATLNFIGMKFLVFRNIVSSGR
jgi:putative flippase GtrA